MQARSAAAANVHGFDGQFTVSSWLAGWCCCHSTAQCWLACLWLVCMLGLAACIQASPGAALQWRIPTFSTSTHFRLHSDQFEVCSTPW